MPFGPGRYFYELPKIWHPVNTYGQFTDPGPQLPEWAKPKRQRRFQKEFLDGEERGVVMQEESHVERYTAVVCDNCNTRTEIEPDHVVDLLADNVKLQMLAAESRGVTVITNPKLQVM